MRFHQTMREEKISPKIARLNPLYPGWRRLVGRAAALLLAAAFPALASAQTTTNWLGGDGNWNDNAKWDGGVPNDSTFGAHIDNGLTGTDSTVTVNGSFAVGALTIDAGDSVLVDAGHSLTIGGGAFVGADTLANSGTITLAPVSGNAYLAFDSDVTLNGGGTITMGGDATNGVNNVSASFVGSRLTNADNTIQGFGFLGGNTTAITNQGVIDANVSGTTLFVDPITVSGGIVKFLNDTGGTLRASNGGTVNLQDGAYTNNGTFESRNGSTIEFAATGVTLTNNSGGTLTGGTYNAISTGNVAILNLPGGNVTNNAAAVYLSGALANIPQIDTITQNTLDGEFHVLGGRSFTVAGSFTNNGGLVEVGSASTLTTGGSGSYTQNSGTTIVNGSLEATGGSVSIYDGTLSGHGTIHGNVQNTGTVSPGNSPGTLTITGNYNQGSLGTLDIQIGGLTAGTEYDVLSVTGSAGLAGTLNVSLLGFTPSFGDTFTILTSGGRSGIFNTVILPADLTLTYTVNSVVLTAVPEPTSLGVFAAAMLGLVTRRKRPGACRS